MIQLWMLISSDDDPPERFIERPSKIALDERRAAKRMMAGRQLGLFRRERDCASCSSSATFERAVEVGWYEFETTGSVSAKGFACSTDCLIDAMRRSSRSKANPDTRKTVPLDLERSELDDIF